MYEREKGKKEEEEAEEGDRKAICNYQRVHCVSTPPIEATKKDNVAYHGRKRVSEVTSQMNLSSFLLHISPVNIVFPSCARRLRSSLANCEELFWKWEYECTCKITSFLASLFARHRLDRIYFATMCRPE